MNMLTNKVPFGLLSEEEKEMFHDVSPNQLQLWGNSEWIDVASDQAMRKAVYRLKLKAGEFYTFKANGSTLTMPFLKQADGAIYFRDDKQTKSFPLDTFEHIQLSTQAEIDSVKPEFKRGDVVVVEEINLCRVGFCGNNINLTSMHFGDNWSTKPENFKLATPDQTKQLELEEMKHGKKWNGEGYDEWLTADGLTLNELLEHDLSEIEYKSSITYKEVWRATVNDKEDFNKEYTVLNLKHFRLKPKGEGFVDVEITEWNKFGEPMFKMKEGYMLSGYKFNPEETDMTDEKKYMSKEFGDLIKDSAVLLKNFGKEIQCKATHVRFCKVCE